MLVTSSLGPVLQQLLNTLCVDVLCVTWGDHKWKHCLETRPPSFLCAMALETAWAVWSLTTQVIKSYKVIWLMNLQYTGNAWCTYDISWLTGWQVTWHWSVTDFLWFWKSFYNQPAALWGFVHLKWIFCCDRKRTIFCFPYLQHSHPVWQTLLWKEGHQSNPWGTLI